jgi:F-type H+-transporting ATPase subunit delta
MKLNKEARKMSRDLFNASFAEGALDAGKVRSQVQALISRKPRQYVNVLKNYQRLLRLELAKRHAIIESATALSPDTAARVVEDLKARYGRSLTADFKITPELIGGLRIRVGNDVWDGSVQGRLTRLQNDLATV